MSAEFEIEVGQSIDEIVRGVLEEEFSDLEERSIQVNGSVNGFQWSVPLDERDVSQRVLVTSDPTAGPGERLMVNVLVGAGQGSVPHHRIGRRNIDTQDLSGEFRKWLQTTVQEARSKVRGEKNSPSRQRR